MTFKKTYLALAIVATLLSGCSSTDEEGIDATATEQGTDASTSALNGDGSMAGSEFGSGSGFGNSTDLASGYGTAEGNTASHLGPEFSDPSNPLSRQTIYFEFDSSRIQSQFMAVLQAHARYLVSHPQQRVILGGHADERGSSEYNIALGEQRGKAVERVLRSAGVADNQLEVVSYGEEKPAAMGSDEASWQLNRRVELGYQ